MGKLRRTRASLRVFGDHLVPDEVSAWLGASPTSSRRKGEAKTGSWILEVDPREPGDLDGQLLELLGRMTSELDVWRRLTAAYRVDVFCGLFMAEGNDGQSLSLAVLGALAERGLVLDMDFYGPPAEE